MDSERAAIRDEEKGKPDVVNSLSSPGPGQPYYNTDDLSTKMWGLCIKHAERYDADMLDRWKADMDGILIYTGVFSATVAAFLVDSYKYLKRDPTEASQRLLEQVTQQLAAISNGERVTVQALEAFKAPRYAIHVNIFWFLSLCLALSAGLGATLVQQWLRRYTRLIQRPKSPIRRVRGRAFLFFGMHFFHIRWFIENISLMLHAAIFLFFAGLVEFLFAFNDEVAEIILVAVSVFAALYITLTGLPVIFRNCPFQTPLTSVLWYIGHSIAIGFLFPFRCSWHVRAISEGLVRNVRHGYDAYIMSYVMSYVRHKIYWDKTALRQTLDLCRDDGEVEAFLEAIPGYLYTDNKNGFRIIDSRSSSRIDDIASLFIKHEQCLSLGQRIGHVLTSCIKGEGMDDGARRRRAITCSRAVSEISKAFLSLLAPASFSLDLPPAATSRLQLLSRDHDLQIASSALNASAILERALLEQLSDATTKWETDRSTMANRVLADVIGENDSGSRRFRGGFPGGDRSDGRLIAVTEYMLGILGLIESSWKPALAELEEVKSTLQELCRGLNGADYSDAAQERFVHILGNTLDAELPDDPTGKRSLTGTHRSFIDSSTQSLVSTLEAKHIASLRNRGNRGSVISSS